MVGYAIAFLALGLLITLFLLNPPNLRSISNSSRSENSERAMRTTPVSFSSSSGRDRVPGGWYMAPSATPSAPRGGAAPGDGPIPARAIRAWSAGAIAFAALSVLAWATGRAGLGVAIALLAAFALAVAVRDVRHNRWLREAATWNTGHHHEFPAPRA
jgi:hypothetical protein